MSDAVLSNEALLLLILGHLNEQNRLLVLRPLGPQAARGGP